jgi:hypothetical protein
MGEGDQARGAVWQPGVLGKRGDGGGVGFFLLVEGRREAVDDLLEEAVGGFEGGE